MILKSEARSQFVIQFRYSSVSAIILQNAESGFESFDNLLGIRKRPSRRKPSARGKGNNRPLVAEKIVSSIRKRVS